MFGFMKSNQSPLGSEETRPRRWCDPRGRVQVGGIALQALQRVGGWGECKGLPGGPAQVPGICRAGPQRQTNSSS